MAAPAAALATLRPDPLPGKIKGGHLEMNIWDDSWDNTTPAGSPTFEKVWEVIDEFESGARMSRGLAPWEGIVGRKGT